MDKKVLFDGTAAQSNSSALFHGGGEYAKYVLQKAIEQGYKFDVVLSNNLFLDEQTEELLLNSETNVHRINNKQDIYNLIDNNHYTTFYSVLPAKYTDYKGPAKMIGVVHGLRGAELPWDFYRFKYEIDWRQRYLGWFISHFPFIQTYLKHKHIAQSHTLLQVPNAFFITVSNHTKNSLLSFYPELKPENIQVFYSPFSVRQIGLADNKDDYFLMVSGNRYEKNVYRAVKVFDKLFSDGRLDSKKVVITGCGKQPFWKEIKNPNRFCLKPYVTTDELEHLYEHAFCFVYPSLNEGFGYPPLKAMSYGTPVIASSATSIPEICDDAACFFTPTNQDDLASRILRVTLDDDYRYLLAERGLRRVKDLQERQNKELGVLLDMIFNKN